MPLIAVLAGVVATVVAGVAPSVRVVAGAARGRVARSGGRAAATSSRAAIIGGVLTAGGVVALVVAAARVPGRSASPASVPLLTLVGMVVFGPVAVGPAASVLGTPDRRAAWHHRDARAGERDAQPAPDGGHRVGAADRRCGRRDVHDGGGVAQGVGRRRECARR